MKIFKTFLCLLLCTSVYSKDDNAAGFEVSKMLSHKALSQDSEAYPKGEVVKTMNVSGYTYFQFQNKDKLTWAAASSMELKKGDRVILLKSFPMTDFKSKTLDITFDEILFVSQMDVVKPNATN